MTAGFDTRRVLRGLVLTVIVGCCALVSLTQPGFAQHAPGPDASVTTSSTGPHDAPNVPTEGSFTNIPSVDDPAGSPGSEPLPSAATTSPSVARVNDDTPADVRLVFGFTAGTVLVLSALAFLDRRPEP